MNVMSLKLRPTHNDQILFSFFWYWFSPIHNIFMLNSTWSEMCCCSHFIFDIWIYSPNFFTNSKSNSLHYMSQTKPNFGLLFERGRELCYPTKLLANKNRTNNVFVSNLWWDKKKQTTTQKIVLNWKNSPNWHMKVKLVCFFFFSQLIQFVVYRFDVNHIM